MTDFERLVLLLGCKATLILGLVAGLFALTGRRWPQNCMLGQRLGVMAVLALPVAVCALPTVGIPVLSAPRPIAVADEVGLTGQLANPFPLTAGGETASRRNRSAGLPAASAAEPALRGLPPTNISIPGLCLAAAYGVVVVALLIRFVRAWHGLAQLKRASSRVVDPSWQTTLKHWSTVLQVVRPVELRMSDTVSVPMTFCWRAPVILIPGDCLSTCDQTQRDAILVHELTHIAHGDFFWQAMTRFAAALYWMHPLMWLIRRQDGTLCERICDAFCSHHLSRESYARALVRIAGRKILRPAAALGIQMAHTSSLRRRLTDLQTGATSRYSLLTRTQRVLLGGTAGLILSLIVVGTLTARASAEGTKAAPVDSFRLPATIDGQVLDQKDKPVAKANVILSIVRCDPRGHPTGAAAPQPWTASTDDQGRYRFETSAPSLGPGDVLSIKIRAEGFPELSTHYFGQAGAQGALPVQRLPTGRTVSGRLVDPQGNPVAEASVRFQASSDLLMLWDSGPLRVDQRGMFSVLIPKDGLAAVSIYPRGFAPQIVKVPKNETALGPIRVESGTSLTGRVVDKEGRGVAGTVVAIQQSEGLHYLSLGIRLGTAVKTDENGSFRLPPVRGTYRVLVTSDAPDYSRRLTVTGAAPPPILPQENDFNGKDKTREVVLREAGSVTVRGTVRWADGSGAPDIEIKSEMLPPGWKEGAHLASTRTDSKGRYVLRLPAPVKGVLISVDQPIRAPDGTFQQARPVGRSAKASQLRFDLLTDDVNDADWLVGSKE
jgi:beta-lactamase regulating signal transducer with metallopeptidase domain